MAALAFRTVILILPFFLGACGTKSQAEQRVPEAPTENEERLLNLSLAGMGGETRKQCVVSSVRPATTMFWPDVLSFNGEREQVRQGDARFDEIARSWDRAKPKRSESFRIPRQALRLGFSIIEDASSASSCPERLTLYSPVFQGDFAFAIGDVQTASAAGGDIHVSVFRLRKKQWESVAYGRTSWGRPII